MGRRLGEEYTGEDFITHPAIQRDSPLQIILKGILPFEDDKGTDASLGQFKSSVGHLFYHQPAERFGSAQKEADRAHPVQDLTDFRLKYDDDDDQDDGPEILENPAGHEEPGPPGEGIKDPQRQKGDQDS